MDHFIKGFVYGATLAGMFSFDLVRSKNEEIKRLDSKLKVSQEMNRTLEAILDDAQDRLADQDEDTYEDFVSSTKERIEFFNVAHMVFF